MKRRLSFMLHAMLRNAMLGAVVVLLSGVGAKAHAGTDRENELKAAMIYNFVRFTHWPDTAFSGSPEELVICSPGEGPINAALGKIEGKRIRGKRIVLEKNPDAVLRSNECRVLVAGQALDEAFQLRRSENILIISVKDNVESDLASIRMIRVGRQIRFAVNLAAAKAGGVEISSKLIDLAVRVD